MRWRRRPLRPNCHRWRTPGRRRGRPDTRPPRPPLQLVAAEPGPTVDLRAPGALQQAVAAQASLVWGRSGDDVGVATEVPSRWPRGSLAAAVRGAALPSPGGAGGPGERNRGAWLGLPSACAGVGRRRHARRRRTRACSRFLMRDDVLISSCVTRSQEGADQRKDKVMRREG